MKPMRRVYQLLSAVALAGTILPSAAYLFGRMELGQVAQMMLAATVLWFVATPLWMERKTAGQ